MNYPVINNITDILPHIKEYPEFKINSIGDIKIIQYMYRDNKTFSDYGHEYRKECRGITFDANTGDIICRPFHKFFNVNETEATFEKNINWDNIQSVMDKMDGSMISAFLLHGELKWKTKNSVGHPVVLKCYELYPKGSNEYEMSYHLALSGYTPIFEFTSLINRVVIRYPENELTLLAVRHNITGEYLSQHEIKNVADTYNVKLVDSHKFTSVVDIKQQLSNQKYFEGYVFVDQNGERFKWKSNWYNELHHVVSFLTECNIAKMALNDNLDDYKSFLVDTESPEILSKVEIIESKVKNDLIAVEQIVNEIVDLNKGDTPKEFSLKYRDHELFHLMISKLRGKEPNYLDYYDRRLENIFSKESL
jgi:T4 RnlA family RNA ligase